MSSRIRLLRAKHMDDELFLTRVFGDISKNKLLSNGDAVIVGLSGGADSVCLLRVLYELQRKLEIKITAVHINHGLRGMESDQDEAFVNELCKSWSIALKTFFADIKGLSRMSGISLEEAGRKARYETFNKVMEESGAECIAVAHNLEDQAETVMLNILRGTGLDGLCGMEIKQGRIIRPLLNISRNDIVKHLDSLSIPYRIDSSNSQNQYTRNRVRNILFPMLKDMFGIDPTMKFVRLSSIVREDNRVLDDLSEDCYRNVLVIDTDDKIEICLGGLKNFPPAIIKRIIRLAWEKLYKSRKNLEQVHVEQIMELCLNARTGKKVILPKGFEASLSYDKLILSRQGLKSEHYSYTITVDGSTIVPEAHGTLNARIMDCEKAIKCYGTLDSLKENSQIQLFCIEKLNGEISIRNRREGDRIRPYRGSGEKKLKDFFIDQKIPREKRENMPLVAQGNKILWIVGMRTSEDFRTNDCKSRVLVLEWHDL